MHIDGACHCGRVTFSAEVDPDNIMVCHCTDCQVLSGSAYRAVIPARVEDLVVHGETRSYVKVADSGNRRAQVFCPECATPLWGAAPENGTHVTIRLGCVNQRAALAPTRQVWLRSALPWHSHIADLPGVPEQAPYQPTKEAR